MLHQRESHHVPDSQMGDRVPSSGAATGPAEASARLIYATPPLTTKAGPVFVLCADDGDIDRAANAAHGIYFRDMRYLDRATLRLNGMPLDVLLALDNAGDRTICELTNAELPNAEGGSIRQETLGVRRERHLTGPIVERITVRNFNQHAVALRLDLELDARFDDMFTVRGATPGQRGHLHLPRWDGSCLTFRYDGADGRTRTTECRFDRPPTSHTGGALAYALTLPARAEWSVTITTVLRDADAPDRSIEPAPITDEGTFSRVVVETDNPLFDRVLRRSIDDLQMLVTSEQEGTFLAAGVPWFVALFGRDSIITALQVLAFRPDLAAATLRLLARYQGRQRDDWRDEEPGKIPHELRVGEMANLGEIPHTPYYGTVDATPLFICLLGEYVRWTGDLALWRELRPNVERALSWIDEWGDSDGDGFTDYTARSAEGLVNQGWKDSRNGIAHEDGSLAVPPIALVEVQGYVYRAKLDAAWLYEQDGDLPMWRRLRMEAADLRKRFRAAYWMADRQFLGIALERDGGLVRSLTSNAGQALWSGIVEPGDAAAVCDCLLDPVLFSGWGVRTMATTEAAYNPLDYQVGAVWPHDNSLIAAGLKRYGHGEGAALLFSALFEAATHFRDYRLPELFAGVEKHRYGVPVRYSVACSPQSWAAGSIPYLLQTTLGIAPDALNQRLLVSRPTLPNWLTRVTLRGLRIGGTLADLRFERSGDLTLVAVVRRDGPLDVRIEY